MKIQIDVRWPRVLRDRPRWARLTVVGLLAATVVAVPVAWASHDFTDVPTASPFHLAISSVKTAGITAGKTCVPPGTPPTYCPGEAITREAMAAFMQRGLPRIEEDQSLDGPDIVEGAAFADIITGSMTVGGVSGTQFVTVNAWATIDAAGITGPCEFRGMITQDQGTAGEVVGQDNFLEVEAGDADIDATFHAQNSFIATSGAHDYTLSIQRWNGCLTSDVDNDFEVDENGITVITIPINQFGDGSTTLGTLEARPAPTGNEATNK